MASPFDHILNALDVVLKAGDRRAAEQQQDRAAAATARKKTRIKGFGDKTAPKDSSCCIKPRDGGGQS